MSRLPGENLKKNTYFFFSNYCPLQIWTLKICNQDCLKIIIARHVKFSKKNAGQRATTNFHKAIFAQRTHDIYITVNKKTQVKGMVWITVLSSVNIEDI